MEDALLDMRQDKLVIKETQHGDSPATFYGNLVDCFGIIGCNTQTGSETINPTDNKKFDLICKMINKLSGVTSVAKIDFVFFLENDKGVDKRVGT